MAKKAQTSRVGEKIMTVTVERPLEPQVDDLAEVGLDDEKYTIVSLSKSNAIVRDGQEIERMVSLTEIRVIFPLKVGQRYLFTGARKKGTPCGDCSVFLAGVWTVSRVNTDRSFELCSPWGGYGESRDIDQKIKWRLHDFVDITPMQESSVIL